MPSLLIQNKGNKKEASSPSNSKKNREKCFRYWLFVYFFNTQTHSVSVAFELLILCHGHHGITNAAYAIIGKMLEGYLPVIAVEVHTVVCQSVAVGGQCVVCAAGIVAALSQAYFPRNTLPAFTTFSESSS